MVAVSDEEDTLGVPYADLDHTGDAFVDAEELVLWDDAHGLDHHQDRLMVLSTLHVVWDAHVCIQGL